MMPLWNRNIFRITSPFVRGIHRSSVSAAELLWFLWSAPEHIRLSKQSRHRWFEMPSRSLWRHCNEAFHLVHTKKYANDLVWLYFALVISHFGSPMWIKYWYHDDVIKWKHFPRYWPFVRRILRSPVNSPHKGQWREALMFSLIC